MAVWPTREEGETRPCLVPYSLLIIPAEISREKQTASSLEPKRGWCAVLNLSTRCTAVVSLLKWVRGDICPNWSYLWVCTHCFLNSWLEIEMAVLQVASSWENINFSSFREGLWYRLYAKLPNQVGPREQPRRTGYNTIKFAILVPRSVGRVICIFERQTEWSL